MPNKAGGVFVSVRMSVCRGGGGGGRSRRSSQLVGQISRLNIMVERFTKLGVSNNSWSRDGSHCLFLFLHSFLFPFLYFICLKTSYTSCEHLVQWRKQTRDICEIISSFWLFTTCAI